MNNSLTAKKGTLRGLHYQLPPAAEVKVVRAIKGALWDVHRRSARRLADLRQMVRRRADADNRLMMYVPRGFAHGFLTLTDDAEALYLVSDFYGPAAERGVRWDDPGGQRSTGRSNRESDLGQGSQVARSRSGISRR